MSEDAAYSSEALEVIECGAEIIADILDLSSRRLRQLADEGIVPKAGHGRYPLAGCVRGYLKYLRNLGGGEAESLTRERVRVQRETADRIARENRLATGELVPVGEVRAVLETAFAHCRGRLLALPSRAAALIADEDGPARRQEILTDLIHEALTELSQTRVEATAADPAEHAEAEGEADAHS